MFRVLVGLGVLFVGLGALFLVGGLIKGPGQAVTQGTILITAGLSVLAIYEIHHRLVKLREAFESLERRQNQILDVLMRQTTASANRVLNGPPAPMAPRAPLSVAAEAIPASVPAAPQASEATEAAVSAQSSPVEGIPADEPRENSG